ncbi:hypothetical protein GIB67_040357 [Kingdonia uniflora]|uniref:DUF4283 domain-containing protein n=1 Tax=Kingdonia uniflora TaxID=39325 RepID=A0A7J7L9I5_9MAGN|nr:hypothetical protein GIB67_040357 [Kingdonia uniflora]
MLEFEHIMVRMKSEKDVTRAFFRELIQSKGFFFKLARWAIDFDRKKDSPFAPVWVQFPGLKLHLQNNGIVKELAGLIGKYFITDIIILSLSRPSTVRACVKVNLTKELPTKVGLALTKSFILEQSVIYERLPMLCLHCCLQGHNKLNCMKTNPIVLTDKRDEFQKGKTSMGRSVLVKGGNINIPN